MKPIEIRPWRQSPFVVGRHYRVRHDFQALRDRFEAGEVLVYERDAYSRYDSCTGYFFSQPDVTYLRTWDVYDEEELEVWRELFEEILDD